MQILADESIDRQTVERLRLDQHTVLYIAEPERIRQLRQYLETIGHEMAGSGDYERQKMGMQLVLAAGTLDSWDLGKHPLAYEVYIAQVRQMGEPGSAEGASAEREALFLRLQDQRAAYVKANPRP